MNNTATAVQTTDTPSARAMTTASANDATSGVSTPSPTATATAKQPTSARREEALLPPVDVVEDAQGITLYADLPGVPREQLQLRVEADQLIIEAEMRLDLPEGLRPGHAEVTRQHYRRAFTLSKELDAEQVSADLTHGVLRVRLPKAAHAQKRKIAVTVN